jgi:uncharacterized protein YbaR (Trm112 family)
METCEIDTMTNPINPDLLAILVCPETHQPVQLAPQDQLEALQARQKDGSLKNRSGAAVTEAFEQVLVREDGKFGYLVIDGIPVMLTDEAIALD